MKRAGAEIYMPDVKKAERNRLVFEWFLPAFLHYLKYSFQGLHLRMIFLKYRMYEEDRMYI